MPPIPRQRRGVGILAAAALWLVVGSGLCIAVAWISMFLNKVEGIQGETVPLDESAVWPHPVPSDWPPNVQNGYFLHRPMYDLAILGQARYAPKPPSTFKIPRMFVMTDIRIGVPMRCLSEWTISESILGSKIGPGTPHGSLIFKPPFYKEVDLPVGPIWPGLAFDSVCFGGVAFGLWRFQSAIRQRRRRRLSQCLYCGYSLTGLATDAGCPECGREHKSGGPPKLGPPV